MENLQDVLGKLSDREIDFVFARSNTKTDKEARDEVGISNGLWYGWSEERREYLVDVANALRVDTKLKARRIIQNALEKAALIKVRALDSRKESIAQAAATEIMDRELGKPTQRQELTGKDGGPVAMNWKNFVEKSNDTDTEGSIE